MRVIHFLTLILLTQSFSLEAANEPDAIEQGQAETGGDNQEGDAALEKDLQSFENEMNADNAGEGTEQSLWEGSAPEGVVETGNPD